MVVHGEVQLEREVPFRPYGWALGLGLMHAQIDIFQWSGSVPSFNARLIGFGERQSSKAENKARWTMKLLSNNARRWHRTAPASFLASLSASPGSNYI